MYRVKDGNLSLVAHIALAEAIATGGKAVDILQPHERQEGDG